MGQPSPEVSLLPYQYGILTARFFTTRLALAFRLIASFSFANSRPQSPYDYIISRRVCANYRNFCNRKSSHHTDTEFCACSLNCQRAVSVRGKSFFKVCPLTNFIIPLIYVFFKANFFHKSLFFSQFSSYLFPTIKYPFKTFLTL